MGEQVIHHITTTKEHEAFKSNYRKSILFFGCTNCKACDDLYPLYYRIADRYKEKVKFAYIDVDQCGLDFTTVPFFVSLVNGKILNRMIGATPDELRTFIGDCIRAKN
jgi:thiol-disulfide isomerase/thioredoxin